MCRSRTFVIDVSTFVSTIILSHTHQRLRDWLRVRFELEEPAAGGFVCVSNPWSVRDWQRPTMSCSSLMAPDWGWLWSAAVCRLLLMFVIFFQDCTPTRLCTSPHVFSPCIAIWLQTLPRCFMLNLITHFLIHDDTGVTWTFKAENEVPDREWIFHNNFYFFWPSRCVTFESLHFIHSLR